MAKKLVAQAGAVAKQPIVLAIPAGTQEVADVGQVVEQSAAAVGLNVRLKTVPLAQFGALFSDPSTRKGDDLIFTINYDQDPDPLSIYDDIAQPTGISNFNRYDNPKVTQLRPGQDDDRPGQKGFARDPARRCSAGPAMGSPLDFAQRELREKWDLRSPAGLLDDGRSWATSLGGC